MTGLLGLVSGSGIEYRLIHLQTGDVRVGPLLALGRDDGRLLQRVSSQSRQRQPCSSPSGRPQAPQGLSPALQNHSCSQPSSVAKRVEGRSGQRARSMVGVHGATYHQAVAAARAGGHTVRVVSAEVRRAVRRKSADTSGWQGASGVHWCRRQCAGRERRHESITGGLYQRTRPTREYRVRYRAKCSAKTRRVRRAWGEQKGGGGGRRAGRRPGGADRLISKGPRRGR